MSKPFRPMKYPNKLVEPEEMEYPLIASQKLDGIRCVFKGGEMLSRSGKQIPNKQLHSKYTNLKKISKSLGLVFDGELYQHGIEFGEVQSIVMSHDKEVPDHFSFWMFDVFDPESPDMEYKHRLRQVHNLCRNYKINTPSVYKCKGPEDVKMLSEAAYESGYEG